MKAVHFGAGNIGRGFIGEVLAKNGFSITFVDINEGIIYALQDRGAYTIEYAAEAQEQFEVDEVDGINNQANPEAVIEAIQTADIVTTAIGPNVLPHIAELIAQGIEARRNANVTQKIDMLACENMIGGSDFLHEQVAKYLSDEAKAYVEEFIGFPNAAVDRIVPDQQHEDPLFVSVEPFKEWVIDDTTSKGRHIRLEGVLYVEDLEPYIERKLFSVNTGHATVAYAGRYFGYATIDEAINDERVLSLLREVLAETGALIIDKWDFDAQEHAEYVQKIINRFKNPHISDLITRVGRTPIRKLGKDERFIRPIREAKERNLSYSALAQVVGMIFAYDNPEDSESVQLQAMLKEKSLESVIKEITELTDENLISQIVNEHEKLSKETS